MDAPEPDTPFAAVTAQTTRFGRVSASLKLSHTDQNVEESREVPLTVT